MMKKILILTNKIEERDSYITNFLKANLGKDTKVFLDVFPSINLEISQGRVECQSDSLNLASLNMVYMRVGRRNIQLAGAIACFLNSKGIKVIDHNFVNLGPAGNKLYKIVKLALSDIPVPLSLYFSKKEVMRNKDKIIRKLGFPIFAKSLIKQRREGLFYITKEVDFEKLLNQNQSRGFLFQKTVDIGEEYRLVVMGGKVTAVHREQRRKIGDNRILVNSKESIDGWIDPNEVPKEMRKIVEEATGALNLNISGADACIERKTSKIYVFEINRGPGLTLNPKVSPELRELARYLRSLL